MRKLSTVLVLLLVLVGCTRGVHDNAEVLVFSDPVDHLDLLAREPMVVEHPQGSLFLSGYGGSKHGEPPILWNSGDGGASWERVDIGTSADGADGNSDVDLAVAADGTLYFLTMGFDRTTFEGTHIAIGVSHDVGVSWTWTYLSQDRFDDRPWVDLAPDGTAHVIWNDGKGISHTTSTDRGHSWVEQPRIHSKGGSSHLAVGPSGEVAVRITSLSASANRFDEGVEWIAVSTDGGQSWTKHASPSQPVWDPTFRDPDLIPRWVEPVAWDAAGALYHLWSEGRELWLARSVDRGETWKKWSVAHDDDRVFFPYLVARDPGELAATWFSGRDEALHANVARIILSSEEDAAPNVQMLESFQPDTWTRGEEPQSRAPAGEYFPVIFLSDGGLGVASTIQNPETQRFGFSWRRTSP